MLRNQITKQLLISLSVGVLSSSTCYADIFELLANSGKIIKRVLKAPKQGQTYQSGAAAGIFVSAEKKSQGTQQFLHGEKEESEERKFRQQKTHPLREAFRKSYFTPAAPPLFIPAADSDDESHESTGVGPESITLLTHFRLFELPLQLDLKREKEALSQSKHAVAAEKKIIEHLRTHADSETAIFVEGLFIDVNREDLDENVEPSVPFEAKLLKYLEEERPLVRSAIEGFRRKFKEIQRIFPDGVPGQLWQMTDAQTQALTYHGAHWILLATGEIQQLKATTEPRFEAEITRRIERIQETLYLDQLELGKAQDMAYRYHKSSDQPVWIDINEAELKIKNLTAAIQEKKKAKRRLIYEVRQTLALSKLQQYSEKKAILLMGAGHTRDLTRRFESEEWKHSRFEFIDTADVTEDLDRLSLIQLMNATFR